MREIKPLEESILVLVHVKKTGGISLQYLLSKQYGSRFYGGYTHGFLKDIVPKNKLSKKDIIHVSQGSCICKHWSVFQYKKIEDKCNFVTILRHPLDRIVSHFNFYKMHHSKQNISFLEYMKWECNRNVYHKYCGNMDKFCEIYNFANLKKSIHKSKIIENRDLPTSNKTKYTYKPTTKEIHEFMSFNNKDMKLYEKNIVCSL